MRRIGSALSGVARSVHPKVAGAGGGSAAGGALAVLLSAVGVHLDAAEIAALGTVATLLAGWLTPARKAPPPVLGYVDSHLAMKVTRSDPDEDHHSLRREVAALNERTQEIMLDLTALQADVKALAATVADLEAAFQGSAAQQADIDMLDADVRAAQQKIAALLPAPPPPAAPTVSVAISPASLAADGVSTAQVTVTVTDASGSPLSSETVTLGSSDPGQAISSPVDAGNGSYTATLTASRTPGTATITATDGIASSTATVTQA